MTLHIYKLNTITTNNDDNGIEENETWTEFISEKWNYLYVHCYQIYMIWYYKRLRNS